MLITFPRCFSYTIYFIQEMGLFLLVGSPLPPLFLTSGFWPRVRARALRAPVFLGSLPRPPLLCAPPPPIAASLHPPKVKKNILETKCFPSGPYSGRQGHISFHWTKLHPSELHCTFLIYAATSWAPLHPYELHCTLLSYAATKLCCIQLSYAAPSELSCTLLS